MTRIAIAPSRAHTLVVMSTLCVAMLLQAGCRRAPDEPKNSPPQVLADPEHLPSYFLIPTFVGKLRKDWPIATGVKGMTRVRYNLGRDFPPTKFINGVRAHLASLGWSETVSSLYDASMKKTGDEAGWIETGMNTPSDLTWGQWWVREEEAMELSVTRLAPRGKPYDNSIVGIIDHYDRVGRKSLRSSPLRQPGKHSGPSGQPQASWRAVED